MTALQEGTVAAVLRHPRYQELLRRRSRTSLLFFAVTGAMPSLAQATPNDNASDRAKERTGRGTVPFPPPQDDPAGLLEGRGRFMRHVKLWPGRAIDEGALRALIVAAHARMRPHA